MIVSNINNTIKYEETKAIATNDIEGAKPCSTKTKACNIKISA